MTAGDEVDRYHVRHERDVRVARRRFLQRLLDRPASGVRHVDDTAVAVPALARQVPAFRFTRIERHAQLGQPLDRGRRILDDELDGAAVVEARARHHRILDMAFERVARLQHRRDPALRAGGGAFRQRPLRQDRDLEMRRKIQRRTEPGGPGADDDDVIAMISHARWRRG